MGYFSQTQAQKLYKAWYDDQFFIYINISGKILLFSVMITVIDNTKASTIEHLNVLWGRRCQSRRYKGLVRRAKWVTNDGPLQLTGFPPDSGNHLHLAWWMRWTVYAFKHVEIKAWIGGKVLIPLGLFTLKQGVSDPPESIGAIRCFRKNG